MKTILFYPTCLFYPNTTCHKTQNVYTVHRPYFSSAVRKGLMSSQITKFSRRVIGVCEVIPIPPNVQHSQPPSVEQRVLYKTGQTINKVGPTRPH